jgi:predicted metal-dependent hydrolase
MSQIEGFSGLKVVRSARRRKTVSATVDKGVLIVRIPARMSKREEAEWIEHMRLKLLSKKDKRSARRSDDALEARARRLAVDYFGGLEFTIVWSTRQQQRWGSCTPFDQSIRLSTNLREFPDYVIDYVIIHELAHLLIADHSPDFWNLCARYPFTDRARGFLEGVAFAER